MFFGIEYYVSGLLHRVRHPLSVNWESGGICIMGKSALLGLKIAKNYGEF